MIYQLLDNFLLSLIIFLYPKGKFGSKPNIEFTDCENLDG